MEKVAPWKIVRTIGQGGQGQVHVVVHETGQPAGDYALKRLVNQKRKDRFEQEIAALGALEHPGILRVIDHDLAKGYLVSDLHPRGDMEKAAAVTWGLEQRLGFFERLLEAVAFAHERDIIHRDLKPSNVLVAIDSCPVIADFGLCLLVDGERLTLTEEAIGSRYYMAPELAAGRAESVTKAVDVYSLGKILYWLLAGRHLDRERHREKQWGLGESYSKQDSERFMRFLDVTVAEEPGRRLKDANAMLTKYKEVLVAVQHAYNVPGRDVPQQCTYCGLGEYEIPHGQVNPDGSVPIGISSQIGISGPGPVLRVMICNKCGQIQLFSIATLKLPKHKNPWA